MTRFVASLCSALPREIEPVPITAVTAIIDLGDTSIRQLWALRSHLQEASTLAQANYPETMGTVVVVNASAFFPTIWGWVKGWFDEVTREKIHILGKNPGSSKMLTSLIDKQHLPKIYGGELDWDFFDPPNLDEDAKKKLGEMPKGPFIFEDEKVKRPKHYEGPLDEGIEMADDIAEPHVQPTSQLNGDAKRETAATDRELNETQLASETDVAEAAKNMSIHDEPEEVTPAPSTSGGVCRLSEGTPEHELAKEDERPTEVHIIDSKIDQAIGKVLDSAVSKLNGSAKPTAETAETYEQKSDPIASVISS